MSQPTADTHGQEILSRPFAEAMGAEDQTDSEAIIQRGGRAIEAMGDDLETASLGGQRHVDMDAARQRLRDCQAALAGLGYVVGEGSDAPQGIDGVDSRPLKDAVLQFQDDNSLEATGKIDRETYETILRVFEQGMSMQAHGQLDDEFSFIQANRSIGSADLQAEDDSLAEGVDDSEQTLIDLQDDIDAGQGPSELEDL